MPHVPDTPAASADSRPPLSTKGLKPSDIDSDKMDELVMRIFNELTRQMNLLEHTGKKNAEEAAVRERDARILASLERTMERLANVEAGRAAARKSQVSKNDGTALEALQREVTRIVTIERERRTLPGSD
ncbi:MAG: hypothetical protein JO056_09465 [Alphaproteobacteria bacterium]|nr:hypothetical protein [Alphaproteobacteria bacterium]